MDDESKVERKEITQPEVKKAILKIKNKKSGDRSRWKAGWLKEEDELIGSLTTIFNRVEEERQIPLPWREKSIKSLYKGGGSKKKIQESHRSIFITNIVSKAYEIVKKIQNEAVQSNMSNMETADCLIEMEEIGYNRNYIKMLQEMNKKAEIIVDTTMGQTKSINIEEIVKQGSVFGYFWTNNMLCNNIKSKQHRGDSTVQLWKN